MPPCLLALAICTIELHLCQKISCACTAVGLCLPLFPLDLTCFLVFTSNDAFALDAPTTSQIHGAWLYLFAGPVFTLHVIIIIDLKKPSVELGFAGHMVIDSCHFSTLFLIAGAPWIFSPMIYPVFSSRVSSSEDDSELLICFNLHSCSTLPLHANTFDIV